MKEVMKLENLLINRNVTDLDKAAIVRKFENIRIQVQLFYG